MREVAPGDVVFSSRDDGRLPVAPVAHRDALQRMGVATDRPIETGSFQPRQLPYLEYHRASVFLMSQRRPG